MDGLNTLNGRLWPDAVTLAAQFFNRNRYFKHHLGIIGSSIYRRLGLELIQSIGHKNHSSNYKKAAVNFFRRVNALLNKRAIH